MLLQWDKRTASCAQTRSPQVTSTVATHCKQHHSHVAGVSPVDERLWKAQGVEVLGCRCQCRADAACCCQCVHCGRQRKDRVEANAPYQNSQVPAEGCCPTRGGRGEASPANHSSAVQTGSLTWLCGAAGQLCCLRDGKGTCEEPYIGCAWLAAREAVFAAGDLLPSEHFVALEL